MRSNLHFAVRNDNGYYLRHLQQSALFILRNLPEFSFVFIITFESYYEGIPGLKERTKIIVEITVTHPTARGVVLTAE